MLVNKRLTAGNVNLLRFLFPNYDLIDEFTIPEKPERPAIYDGDMSYIDLFVERYRSNGMDYIVNAFTSEVNLDDRRILINVVFEKWRKGMMPKYLDSILDNISPEEFLEAVKVKWVSGKWTISKIDDENNFLDLVDSLNKSNFEFINTYFKCLEHNKPYMLESSFLTFLTKAKLKNYVGNSFKYKKKLELYKGKKLNNTLNAIDDSFEYNIDNDELRLLNLLLNIQNSGKNN